MTIKKFIEIYTVDNLLGDGITIGSTTLRNYILNHKSDLEKDEIVKFSKKISTIRIDILNAEALYKKIV